MTSPRVSVLAFIWISSVLVSNIALASATVQSIQYRGQAVSSVDNVKLTVGKSGGQQVSLTLGYVIPSGTRLETPKGVRLELLSSNNNVVGVGPNSDVRIAVSNVGEQYAVNRGSLLAKKGSKKLDFFNITAANGRYQGAAKGTVFGVEVNESGVKFSRQEGVVRLVEQVPVNVAGGQSKKGRPALTVGVQSQLSQESPEMAYTMGASSTPATEFGSYESAARALLAAHEQAVNAQDIWQVIDIDSTLGGLHLEFGQPVAAIESFTEALTLNYQLAPAGQDPVFADNHTSLGYAYMDMERPEMALENFELATQTLDVIDPYSPAFAESLIDQAEAYDMMEEFELSTEVALYAVEILTANIEFGLEEFDLLGGEEDEEMLELVGYMAVEMAYLLDSLGWAYTYAGDDENADAAFKEAEGLDSLLEEEGFDGIY